MKPLPPVDTMPIFPKERVALLNLFSSLKDEQWALPTVCTGWSVKDIAAHLLFDDIRRLSDGRDRYRGERFEPSGTQEFAVELRDFINTRNEAWVAGARGLSPRVITELLKWSGAETEAYFESLDPDAMSHIGVSWAGEEKSANWFDLAREYSERWIHQSQVREAVGAPMLYEEALFGPLLDTMVRAVPHALRAVDAAERTNVAITVTGAAQRRYDVVRQVDRWALFQEGRMTPAAAVTVDADTAWRLFTRGITKADAIARAQVTGDRTFADAVFDTLAIIA